MSLYRMPLGSKLIIYIYIYQKARMQPALNSTYLHMAFYGRIHAFAKQTAVEMREINEQYMLFAGLALCIMAVCKLRRRCNKNVPPGSLGLPIIGQTFGFLRARRSDTSSAWIQKKVAKYGPIFKTSLIGCPTVVMTGKEVNRFLFSNDCRTIVNKQPVTVTRILGKHNLLEISGEHHRRLRSGLMAFLKPEALQKYVGRMESVVDKHLAHYWQGRDTVDVVPLMKRLTFDVACSLLFSLRAGQERDELMADLTTAFKGIWSLPLDFPGTRFRHALNARSRICRRLSSLIRTRKIELQEGRASPAQDLISCLLTIKKDESDRPFTEEEIIDNLILLMIAGHETTSILLSLLVRLLATNATVYQSILQEHRDILALKRPGEALTWDDVQKMKYTWRVAQETLRMTPPVFGGFRKAVKDIQYGSYTIPKGWQLFWVSSNTHMNSDIFADADKFDPSRFDNQRASLPPYSFVAFGAGPRVCAGYDFAKVETAVAVHHLVTRYEWSLVLPDEPITRDPMPCPAMGLPVKIRSIKQLEAC